MRNRSRWTRIVRTPQDARRTAAAVRMTHQRHFLQPEQAFFREGPRAVQQVALLQRRRRHAGSLL